MAEPPPAEIPSLSQRITKAYGQLSPMRSTGLRLILAIVLFMILGAGWIRRINSPEELFVFLAVALVFFFIVMVFAIRDFRKLAQRYMIEKESVYTETMADGSFVNELRDRVHASKSDQPWTAPDIPNLRGE